MCSGGMSAVKQYHNRTIRVICTLCALICSFGVALASLYTLTSEIKTSPERSSHSATDLVEMLGRGPVYFEFDRMVTDLPTDHEELSHYVSLVSAPGPAESESPSRSRKLHAGRLVALSDGTPEWIVKSTSVDSVDHIKLGAEDFLVTWRGFETAANSDGERSEHRDQTLAALADFGIELFATVETREGNIPIADLLATSIGEFHLDQEEISWTASAFASYIPPQTIWWNRYGEEFSFDDLVQEMMARKLNRESCRGLHLVMTLTKILRIDRRCTILSPGVRESLNSYVRRKLADAIQSQLMDGSWPLLWSRSGFSGIRDRTPEDSNVSRILVTGHMLEWIHMLPKDMKPPIDVVQTGSLWVLQNLRSVPEETITKEYCPYTHAVLSLYLACPPEKSQRGMQRGA